MIIKVVLVIIAVLILIVLGTLVSFFIKAVKDLDDSIEEYAKLVNTSQTPQLVCLNTKCPAAHNKLDFCCDIKHVFINEDGHCSYDKDKERML